MKQVTFVIVRYVQCIKQPEEIHGPKIRWCLFPSQQGLITGHDKLKRKPIYILKSQTSQRDSFLRTYVFGTR